MALLGTLAAKKTAGVRGDALARNAQQVLGVRADRELPVVWAVVAKGSLLDKAILVPAALAIGAFLPWLANGPDDPAAQRAGSMPSSSTSNCSTAFGGMTSRAPRSP